MTALSVLYGLAGVTAIGLLVYLFYALFRAEEF